MVNKFRGSFQLHEKTLDKLVNRLEQYNNFLFISRNFLYKKDGLEGEVDALAYDETYDVWHFYEVKSCLKLQYRKKAKEQYQRFCKAFPHRQVKGIYITPYKVERMSSSLPNAI